MTTGAKIRVRYLGAFADATRSKAETCEPAIPSVSGLIDHLLERNGEKFRALIIDPTTGTLRGGTTLLVNGHRRDLEHPLSDGDEVTLLTPVAGGSPR
jgi:MoaD family protein